MRLQDKVAIITGSSRGIGLAIAKAFLKEGAKVVVSGSKKENIEKAIREIYAEIPGAPVLGIKCDVTNDREIEFIIRKTFEHWGKIDILVNNAGITETKSITKTTNEDYERMMRINVFAPFVATREIVNYMTNGGSIINTGSMVGIYGARNQATYSASKFAVHGLTKATAKELGEKNIRVNCVAPGVVETDMVKENVSAEMTQRLTQMIPLKRVASPEDLAGIYVFLASDESKYITGAIISVDGGLIM